MKSLERYKWACETPSDIASLVPILYEYAQQCKHITEFGVRGAVSTSAWLHAKPKRLICYDRNTPACLPELQEIARENGVEFSFVSADTRTLTIEPTDLLFIDTTHDAETVAAELNNNPRMVRKFIIFHDTETWGMVGEGGKLGIRFPIAAFLSCNTHWKQAAHHTHGNGLTILERVKE